MEKRSLYKKTGFKFGCRENSRVERAVSQQDERRISRAHKVRVRRNIPTDLSPVNTPLPSTSKAIQQALQPQCENTIKTTKKALKLLRLEEHKKKLIRFKAEKQKRKEYYLKNKKPSFWLGEGKVETKFLHFSSTKHSLNGTEVAPQPHTPLPRKVWHSGFSSISKKNCTTTGVNTLNTQSCRTLFVGASHSKKNPLTQKTAGRGHGETFQHSIGTSFAPSGFAFRAPSGLLLLKSPRRPATVRFSRSPQQSTTHSSKSPEPRMIPRICTPAAYRKKTGGRVCTPAPNNRTRTGARVCTPAPNNRTRTGARVCTPASNRVKSGARVSTPAPNTKDTVLDSSLICDELTTAEAVPTNDCSPLLEKNQCSTVPIVASTSLCDKKQKLVENETASQKRQSYEKSNSPSPVNAANRILNGSLHKTSSKWDKNFTCADIIDKPLNGSLHKSSSTPDTNFICTDLIDKPLNDSLHKSLSTPDKNFISTDVVDKPLDLSRTEEADEAVLSRVNFERRRKKCSFISLSTNERLSSETQSNSFHVVEYKDGFKTGDCETAFDGDYNTIQKTTNINREKCVSEDFNNKESENSSEIEVIKSEVHINDSSHSHITIKASPLMKVSKKGGTPSETNTSYSKSFNRHSISNHDGLFTVSDISQSPILNTLGSCKRSNEKRWSSSASVKDSMCLSNHLDTDQIGCSPNLQQSKLSKLNSPNMGQLTSKDFISSPSNKVIPITTSASPSDISPKNVTLQSKSTNNFSQTTASPTSITSTPVPIVATPLPIAVRSHCKRVITPATGTLPRRSVRLSSTFTLTPMGQHPVVTTPCSRSTRRSIAAHADVNWGDLCTSDLNTPTPRRKANKNKTTVTPHHVNISSLVMDQDPTSDAGTEIAKKMTKLAKEDYIISEATETTTDSEETTYVTAPPSYISESFNPKNNSSLLQTEESSASHLKIITPSNKLKKSARTLRDISNVEVIGSPDIEGSIIKGPPLQNCNTKTSNQNSVAKSSPKQSNWRVSFVEDKRASPSPTVTLVTAINTNTPTDDFAQLLRPTTPRSTSITPDVWSDTSSVSAIPTPGGATPHRRRRTLMPTKLGGSGRRGQLVRDRENCPPGDNNNRVSLGLFALSGTKTRSPAPSDPLLDPTADLISWDSPHKTGRPKKGRVTQLAAEFENVTKPSPLKLKNGNTPTPRRSSRLSVVFREEGCN